MTRGRYVINAVECDEFKCFDAFEGMPGQSWPKVKQDARAEDWHAPAGGSDEHYCPQHKGRSS